VFQALASPGVSILATVVPRLASAVPQMTEPVTVVLDHVELLDSRDALTRSPNLHWASRRVAAGAHLPAHTTPPVAVLPAQSQMVDAAADALAMDQQQAKDLLEGVGVQLTHAGGGRAGRADRELAGPAVPGRRP
jgi:LuxR family maltose regulon positive regulatory protein